MRWHYIAFVNINKAFFIQYLLNQTIIKCFKVWVWRWPLQKLLTLGTVYLVIHLPNHNMSWVMCELIFIKKWVKIRKKKKKKKEFNPLLQLGTAEHPLPPDFGKHGAANLKLWANAHHRKNFESIIRNKYHQNILRL